MALGLIDDEVVQHRVALEWGDIVGPIGQRGNAGQLGLAVHHHGAASAATAMAGIVEGDGLFVLVDVHQSLERRYVVAVGHFEALLVGRRIL